MRLFSLDLINGLPVHPLIVHSVVVLGPLFALLFIAITFSSKLQKTYGWVTVAGLAVATGSAVLAKESGESLAARVGLPYEHSEYGEKLVVALAVLFALALVWQIFMNKPESDRKLSKNLLNLIGKVGALVAVGVLVLTYLSGHSGASATWEKRIAGEVTPSSASTESSEVSDTSEAAGITLTEVAEHNSVTDCWVAVDGKVYDLTEFASQHPGGEGNIAEICGTDGTSAFKGQHGGESTPINTLSNYEIGLLSE